MLTQIQGLHHVTSLGTDPVANNRFFTQVLGLRRIKKTVNFDHPSVYHLYYGDSIGTPGGVMTYFPFPDKRRGTPGTGEVSTTSFSVPVGSAPKWVARLAAHGVTDLAQDVRFGANRVLFNGPDGDHFALVEAQDDRAAWNAVVADDMAIRGFHAVELMLDEISACADLLHLMGYLREGRAGNVTRFVLPHGGPAATVDLVATPGLSPAKQGAGSVHHVAFSVANRARQLEVREALLDAGYDVTEVRDRTYFKAIYFRAPGGVLFEVATDCPGFDVDEPIETLGRCLRLPSQHEHLRAKLEKSLIQLD